MCDCFHLAFPNWHGPATGAGRRLRGPEQDTEDDSVCEEPEILEGERPRPQGSSPVEEFPAEKTVEEDIDSSPHKSSNKRSRKIGFGSLFDKRSPAKMSESEDTQIGEAGVIVKTVKEACADGLVVTGGGKEGIFIKEVKPDSPAAKHLTVKEGDQILSATVYFDNVSYEDALQILEHAQPYKMEFCVKRKKESTLLEDAESIHPDGTEGGSPYIRTPRKKKHQDRISWPKFPSFGKGHKAQFKRSHSTSEAEEHKKLEMSPTTSDTESPIKSPMKSPDGRGKKKKQKIKLKMKMKGHRSKSVEETQRDEKNLVSEDLIILEDHQTEDRLGKDQSLEKPMAKLVELPQDMDELEYKESPKIADDDAFPNLSGMEQQHEVHLISLGNTLKTTDISDAFAEGSANDTRRSDEGKTERSELKISIGQEEESKTEVDGQLINVEGISGTLYPSAYESDVVNPVVVSQADVATSQLGTDINTEVISKESSEKKPELKSESTETSNLEASVDLLGIGELKEYSKTDKEKQWKEKSVLEKESYGFRTRGPLADIAISKTPFASAVNGLQFITPDSSEKSKQSILPETITVISQPLPKDSFSAVDVEDSHLEIKPSRLPTNNDDITSGLEKRSKLKLPRVDHSGFEIQEPMTKMELIQTHLPKREDIVIPGMEDTKTKPSLQTCGFKVPKVEKIINITKEREIQEEFNVEDVKEAVSKFPALKLPERDITGVLVQREITIMEMKSDKTNMTPRGSPRKISSADSSSTETKIKLGKGESSSSSAIDKDTVRKMPTIDLPYVDEEPITESKIDYTKPKSKNQKTSSDTLLIKDDRKIADVKFKLPKREDIEIPGMEAIKDSFLPSDNKMSERQESKKYSHQQEKKSKKQKKSKTSFGITKPDIQITDAGIDLPKKDVPHKKYHEDIKETKLERDSMFPDVDIMIGEQLEEGKIGESAMLKTKTDIEHLKPSDDIRTRVDDKTETLDSKTDVKVRKFKLPKFDISFPEVKAPKIYSTSKKEVFVSGTQKTAEDQAVSDIKTDLPEGKTGVHPSPLEDLTKIRSADAELKLLVNAPSESDQRVLDTHLKLPDKPHSAGIHVSDVGKDEKYLNEHMKAEGQGSRFRLPKFDIRLPEIKAPKIDLSAAKTELEISLPEKKVGVHPSDDNMQAVPESDSKGSPIKFKIPSITLPKFGHKTLKAEIDISAADLQAKEPETPFTDAELKLSTKTQSADTKRLDLEKEIKLLGVDVSLPEETVHLEGPKTDIRSSVSVPVKRDETTKFKLTSVTIGDVHSTEPDISLPNADLELSAEAPSADVEIPDLDKKEKSLNVDKKTKDIQIEEHGSKFKLPKFGISLPEIKGPKIDSSAAKTEIDISLPEGKVDVHPPEVELKEGAKEVKTDFPEIHSKSLDLQTKGPSFSFPKFGFSKSEVKGPKADVSLPTVDMKLKEGSVDLEDQNMTITVSGDEYGQKESKFGSPSKFKLPSITLPKFATKASKGKEEDIHTAAPEISLPNAELELSAEPLSVDMKMPDLDKEENSLSVDMMARNIEVEGQGSKFKLPKFGIGLPEVKGPKIDSSATKTEIDISLPEAKMEQNYFDVELKAGKTEVRADIPEIEFQGFDVKPKGPSVSFPKFGFSKSEIKVPEADMNLAKLNVKLPDVSLGLEGQNTDIVASVKESGQNNETKFASSANVEVPSVTLPKGEVEVQITAPEISLPSAELELPLSVDVKMAELEKKEKPLTVDMKGRDIEVEGQGSKFKLPKFGISLPEVKGPKLDLSAAKTEIDISLPEGKMEVQPPEVALKERPIEVQAEVPVIDVKTKRPSFSFPKFGFSKSEVKVPEADISLSKDNVKLPEGSVDLEGPSTDITVSMGDSAQKDETKFGSPTKFKLPSITLPKFATKSPKGEIDDVQITGPEISLPSAELELSAEPLSVDVNMAEFEKKEKPLTVDMKGRDIEVEGQGSKFKLPKFGISLPEVKGPKLDLSAAKTEIDISLPEGKIEVQPPEVALKERPIEVQAEVPVIDVKTKRPSFSFPKFGFSKSEVKIPEADISLSKDDVKLPEGSVDLEGPSTDVTVSMGDSAQKDETKFGSPTKFKLPSITLPKFATKSPKGEIDDVQITGPEISLPSAELELSAEPLSVDVNMAEFEKKEKPLTVDMKGRDIEVEGQGSKFKLPKFGISLPEVKGPKFDSSAGKTEIDISLPEGKMEVQPPEVALKERPIEVQAEVPVIDVKTKRPSFSFPKFGFSKSEVKIPEADISLSKDDVKLPEGSVDLEGPSTDITVSMGDSAQKDETKFGSPTKFKLPSITLPKFATKSPKGEIDDVQITGPEINLPSAELELSAEPLSVDLKMVEFEKKEKPLTVDMKGRDIEVEGQGSKFKLPKFGISLPEVKGPKLDSSAGKTEIDKSLPEGKMEVQPPEVALKERPIEVQAEVPEIDVKTKRPSFSFPKFGFSKSEVKIPEADISLSKDDVKLPEGSVDLEGPSTDITVSMGDSAQKDESKFGSPTKFKLPSITLPKFATKSPKGEIDDVQITGPEISLLSAELELSAEPLSVDLKMAEFEKKEKPLTVDMKGRDIEVEGQGSKFKLPKFGISLPEVKGPKLDSSAAKTEIDISLPEGKMEVQPPEVALKERPIEVQAEVPVIDVKTKRPSFSFPKFGFSKSEVKIPEADISLSKDDVKLPEGSVDLEGPSTDITVSMGDSAQKDETKFGSPTKFKLPSITLPKFATKSPKGEIDDVQITGPEINLPSAELELSAEPLSVDVNMAEFEKKEKPLTVDMKGRDIEVEGQGSKFKLPKFGISLPEVKGPKLDSSAGKTEIEKSLPEGKMEVQPPEVALKERPIEVQAEVPEIDVKTKRPSFSFPKFGFSKSEVKIPEADISLSKDDVKLPEGSVDLEGPSTDITVSMGDSAQKDESKFGSPTKFKLPSITLPKFATKSPKGEIDDVQITGPEINLPSAEVEAEPLPAGVKMPNVDKEEKSLSVRMTAKDIQTEGQGSKFKLPKFEISLPEVKGPVINSGTTKIETDISSPEGKMEVSPPDVELNKGAIEVKANLPNMDSKDLDVKTKRPSFSFPKFGFSKSEVKVPEADINLPRVDVKIPEGSLDLEGPNTDITVLAGDSGQKDKTKFGSPTKFKLPSITIPKFGAKVPKGEVENVQITGPEKSVPNAELELAAEPVSTDMKMPGFEKQEKTLTEWQGSKFRLPKFEISLPEVKGPAIDFTAAKTETNISLPKGKMEVQPPVVELKDETTEVKADIPKIDAKGLDVKSKRSGFSFPKFGFSKSEIKVSEADVNFSKAEGQLPEESIGLEGPNIDITVSGDDSGPKDKTKFGSPTKFKLPSLTLPKFATRAPKAELEAVQVTEKEISIPNAELELSAEQLSADMKMPESSKRDLSASKTEIDISLSKREMEVHLPGVESDMPEIDSQGFNVKTKGSGFSLPKFGFSKSEAKVLEADVSLPKADVKLPEKSIDLDVPDSDFTVSVGDSGQKVDQFVGSQTKFKLPSITLPKFETKASIGEVDGMHTTAPEISLPNAELELSAETLSTDIKMAEFDKQEKPLSVDIKGGDLEVEGQGSKFKLPKFGISLPEVKGPKIDSSAAKTEIEISLPEGKMEVHPPEVELKERPTEVKTDTPEIDVKTNRPSISFSKFGFSKSEVKIPKSDIRLSKDDVKLPEGSVNLEGPSTDITVHKGMIEVGLPDVELKKGTTKVKQDIPELDSKGLDVKTKRPSFSFPKFGFSKSDVKVPEAEVSVSKDDAKLPGGSVDFEVPNTDITVSKDDSGQKDKTKFSSPTKFKLPSITLPKFGTKVPKEDKEDMQITGPQLSLPNAELQLSADPLSVDVKIPDLDKEEKSLSVDIKAKDIQFEEHGSKLKLPKFGISVPEVKGPTEIDISLPEGKVEVHTPEVELKEGAMKMKEAIPEIGSKGLEVKTKQPSFSFPKFGSSQSEIKIQEADINKLPEESIDLDVPGSDFTVSVGDSGQRADIIIEGQESKFKLPKFGISLPEVKGPEIDSSATKTNVSLSEGKMEVSLPEVEIKETIPKLQAEVPEIDSKRLNLKTKQPSFLFPKFGFFQSEKKVSEANVNFPKADMKLAEGSVDVGVPSTDITVTIGDSGQKDETKFGSPTKFKLPSITLPKFGAKLPKGVAEDAQILGPENSVPNAELELSSEPLSADINMPEFDKQKKSLSVDMKAKDIETEQQESKFKLPKFGISLPEVKGTKTDSSVAKTEIDISLTKEKFEVHPPDTELKEGKSEVNVDIKEIDSKGPDVKRKGPSFSFPKFGFSKSEVKVPEIDTSLPKADVKLPEVSVDLQGPKTDIAVSMGDSGEKGKTKFGSPTKFKLPSITLPKFGATVPKGEVEGVQIKGPDKSVPSAELELSAEHPSAEMSEFDKQEETLGVDIKERNIQIEGQGSKFKLPTFGISLPEVKGPKIDLSSAKTKTEMSLPSKGSVDTALEVQVKGPEMSLPDAELKLSAGPLSGEIKGSDVAQMETPFITDTKVQSIHIEGQGSKFKLPKFGISLPEKKGTKTDLGAAKTEGKGELNLPKAEISLIKKVIPDSTAKLNVTGKDIKLHDSQADVEVKDTIQGPPGPSLKMEEGDKGSPSRFKLPSVKMSKISMSKTKSQDGDSNTNMSANIPEVDLEPKRKKDSEGHEKSSKFSMPTIGDVLRGFDVEFNVPRLDEIEGAKTSTSAPVKLEYEKEVKNEVSTEATAKYKEEGAQEITTITFKLPKLGINLPSDEGDKKVDSEASLENNEKKMVAETDEKSVSEDKPMKPDKSGWFRFPKFSSPTKTAKATDKESSQPPQKTEESPVSDKEEREKKPEQSSSRGIEEDSVSPTLSLRSSDAFADVSSALTTEHICLSLASPTKVKVKYSESTATVEISDLHGDVITSTARTELISMEPHQPEKVNISCSSEMSSSSVDTLREMSGEIHRIVSNIQTVPDTQHAAIFTNVNAKAVETLALQSIAVQSASLLPVDNTRGQKEQHTLVEQYIVTDVVGGGREDYFVTKKTQVFEGDSSDPVSVDTASSIRKLKDTVHTEKMRFFETTESKKQIVVSDETALRHIDSSTEENEMK